MQGCMPFMPCTTEAAGGGTPSASGADGVRRGGAAEKNFGEFCHGFKTVRRRLDYDFGDEQKVS